MTRALATLQEVQAYADVSGNEVVLKLLMAGALVAMGAFTDRNLGSLARVDIRDGNGSNQMTLAQYPITAGTSMKIDGETVPVSTGVDVAGYYVSGERVLKLRGRFGFVKGDGNVEISYVGGYGDQSGSGGADLAPWPDDVKLAYLATVATWFKRRKFQGITSKSLAGESVSVGDSGAGMAGSAQPLPGEARLILESYRNVVPA